MEFSGHHRMLPGMKPRPKILLTEKNNCKELTKSEDIATFIFIKNCENYELKIEGKAAKVMCENCKNITVEIEKSLVSGTFELFKICNGKVKILADCEIPIIQIDDSEVIDIEICNKNQLKSIYFQRTKEINVHEGNDETFHINTSQTVELQNVDEIPQWVAHWNTGMTEFVTERVCRSGIYPSQKQMQSADKEG